MKSEEKWLKLGKVEKSGKKVVKSSEKWEKMGKSGLKVVKSGEKWENVAKSWKKWGKVTKSREK